MDAVIKLCICLSVTAILVGMLSQHSGVSLGVQFRSALSVLSRSKKPSVFAVVDLVFFVCIALWFSTCVVGIYRWLSFV